MAGVFNAASNLITGDQSGGGGGTGQQLSGLAGLAGGGLGLGQTLGLWGQPTTSGWATGSQPPGIYVPGGQPQADVNAQTMLGQQQAYAGQAQPFVGGAETNPWAQGMPQQYANLQNWVQTSLFPQMAGYSGQIGGMAPTYQSWANQVAGYAPQVTGMAPQYQDIASRIGSYAPPLAAGAAGVLNTAFDPRQALYNRMYQQVQDLSNVQQAQGGLAGSPYGAGLGTQAGTNFMIDWANQQLARQAQGLGAAGGALGQAGQLGATQANVLGQIPSLYTTAGGLYGQAGGLDAQSIAAMQAAAQMGGGAADIYKGAIPLPYTGFLQTQMDPLSAIKAGQGISGASFADMLKYLGAGQTAAQTGAQQAAARALIDQQLGGALGGGLQGLGSVLGGVGNWLGGSSPAASDLAGTGFGPDPFAGLTSLGGGMDAGLGSLGATTGALGTGAADTALTDASLFALA